MVGSGTHEANHRLTRRLVGVAWVGKPRPESFSAIGLEPLWAGV